MPEGIKDMASSDDSGARHSHESEHASLLLSQTEHRIAMHQLLCFLRNEFEPAFSPRIEAHFHVSEPRSVSGDMDNEPQPKLRTPPASSKESAVPKIPQYKQLDTLQICQVLKRWCLEHSKELSRIFPNKIEGYNRNDAKEQHGEEAVAEIKCTDTSSKTLYDLALLIHRLTDTVLECRTLIAHNMLSVTSEECTAAMKSAEYMLQLLNRSAQDKGKRMPSHTEAHTGTNTQPPLPYDPSLLQHISPVGWYSLTQTDAKVLIVMELLFALETSVVELFRPHTQSITNSSVPVVCVSSLCLLLRNEQLHQAIQDAVGVHPKPLVLKVMILGEETLRLGSQETKKCELARARPTQPRKYSHLDMIYMARNVFNHSSLDNVSCHLVAQWLASSIAVIELFNVKSQFDQHIQRLRAIDEFLRKHLLKPATIQISSLIIVYRHAMTKAQESCPGLADDKSNESKLSFQICKCQISQAPPLPETHIRTRKPRDSTRSSANLLRIMRKAPSKAFVGRETTLQTLTEAFWAQHKEDEDPKTLEVPRVAILQGHPAIGKSYIALQAVKNIETCSPFHIHYWITASSVELLKSGLATLINVVGMKSVDGTSSMADLIADLQRIMRQYSCLLVVDDVVRDSLPYVQQVVSSLDRRHFVVVTTCVKNLDIGIPATEEEIGPLPMEDCFRLLEYIVVGDGLPLRTTNTIRLQRGHVWRDINSNRPVVERILQEALGRSPLGVSLLGQQFISEMSLNAVLARFFEQDDFSTVTKDNKALFADQHSGLDITVRYILAPIQQEKRLLELLYASSIMSPNGIPIGLLSHYHGDDEGQEESHELRPNFRQHELAALEQTGLLYSEASSSMTQILFKSTLQASDDFELAEEMEGSSSVAEYIYIHQLTQRSLRRILENEFGIRPTKVHRGLARGFWKHMNMDENIPLRLQSDTFGDLKQASRWSECVLNSVFARQVLAGTQKVANSSSQDSDITRVEKDEGSITAGVCFDKIVIDGLLVASSVLLRLEKTKSDTFLKRFLRSILAAPQVVDRERLVNDFVQGTQSQDEAYTIFRLCLAANATLEYFMNCVSLYSRREISSSSAAQQVLHYQTFISSMNTAEQTHDVEQRAGARQGLVNLRVLLRCDMALSFLRDLKITEALQEAEMGAREALPGLKYYKLAAWECRYVMASCFYYQWNHEAAVETIKPVIEEVTMLRGAKAASRYNELLAGCLFHMGRYEEALELRLTSLKFLEQQHPSGLHIDVADAHRDVGEVYSKMKQFITAERHYKLYLEICAELNEPLESVVLLFYYEWGKYSVALEMARNTFFQNISRSRDDFISRLTDLSFQIMAELAMGPTYANNIITLINQNQALVSLCRSEKAPLLYRVYMAMMEARVGFWMGDYDKHWKLAQVAAAIDLGSIAIMVDHLYQQITIITAAVSAVTRRIVKTPLTGSMKAPPSSKEGLDASCTLVDGGATPFLPSTEVKGSDVSHNSSFGAPDTASQEPKLQSEPADLIFRVPEAITYCVNNMEQLRGQTDMGWLFEYARDTLQLVYNRHLAESLGVTLLVEQALESARDTLTYITSSEVEETEWTAMARKLLVCAEKQEGAKQAVS